MKKNFIYLLIAFMTLLACNDQRSVAHRANRKHLHD